MERNCDGSDPRIMDAISRASKNSNCSLCLGARPASGQCEATLGVLRWPHVVCGKSSSASSWISLLGNSSIDQVSELMTCDGDIGEAKVSGQFILNHFSSLASPIHSFDLHMFTEQLLCIRCCHKSWGRVSMKTSLPWDLVPGGEGVHLWTKEWESSLLPWDKLF